MNVNYSIPEHMKHDTSHFRAKRTHWQLIFFPIYHKVIFLSISFSLAHKYTCHSCMQCWLALIWNLSVWMNVETNPMAWHIHVRFERLPWMYSCTQSKMLTQLIDPLIRSGQSFKMEKWFNWKMLPSGHLRVIQIGNLNIKW